VAVAGPADAGTVDGLAYVLYLPEGEARGGVVTCHGAGSVKENHLDFVRACRAHGMAAVAFDQRGHGATGGRMDGRAVGDVVTVASVLPDGPVGLRGIGQRDIGRDAILGREWANARSGVAAR